MFPLYITVFASVVPMSIILPMLPFIGSRYGASAFEVSALFAVMPAIVIFVAPIWGRLSDKFGRKPIFLVSLFMSACSFLVFAWATSFEQMFLARALQGLTGGNVSVAFAMAADQSAPEERAQKLGYVSGAMASGFFLGPVLGGLLMGNDAAGFDHQFPSLVSACLGLLAAAYGVVFLKEARRPGQEAATQTQAVQGPKPLELIRKPAMLMLVIQFLISGVVAGAVQLAFSLWAQGKLDWSPASVSYGIAGMGAAYMLANVFLIGPLTKRFKDEGAYLIGSFMDLLGMCVLLTGALILNAPILAVAGMLFAIMGNGVWTTVLSSVMSRSSPPEHQGVMLGFANGLHMFGRVLGPLLVGVVIEETIFEGPFVVNAILLSFIVGLAIRLNLRRSSKPQPERV